MKSGELAHLAGVTVRTLRHYHAIGLLPEPERHANGYRDYSVSDLLRVLRIRQLASLGFSLEQVTSMLDELDATRAGAGGGCERTDALLTGLDQALSAQIEHLEEQRKLVARLRSGALAADFPERASGALEAMRRLSERAGGAGFLLAMNSDADHLAMGVVAHLDSEPELAEIERVFNAIVDRGLVGEYCEASSLVEKMPGTASEAEREHAAEVILAMLDKIIDCFDAENWLRDDKDYELLLDSATRSEFNGAQLDVSDRVLERLTLRIAQREKRA